MLIRRIMTRLALAGGVLLTTRVAEAQNTWYVDDNGAATAGCSSWADACPELQSALSIAGTGDQVWVAAGIYKPDYDVDTNRHTGDREATFQLINGVAVYGGFDASEKTLEDRAGLFDDTVLHGDLNGDDIIWFPVQWDNADENSYSVVSAVGTDDSAVIDGFTIRQGYAIPFEETTGSGGMIVDGGHATIRRVTFDNNAGFLGGGMRILGGAPRISDCTFTRNNSAEGGGIYIEGGNPRITRCDFLQNIGAGVGGAVSVREADPVFLDCLFASNITGFYAGGGVSNFGGQLVFEGCTFRANDALVWGGGLFNNGGTVMLTDCVFEDNIVGEEGMGGGMANLGEVFMPANASLVDCTFRNNFADLLGGGYLTTGPEAVSELTGCVFTNNFAELGGAMFNDGISTLIGCRLDHNTAALVGGGAANTRELSFVNSEFHDNIALEISGGAIASNSLAQSLSLLNCRLTSNQAPESGGAIRSEASSPDAVTLSNCTFSNNAAATGGAVFNEGSAALIDNSILWADGPDEIVGPAEVTFSDVQGGWPGAGNIDADPLFVEPSGPGGGPLGVGRFAYRLLPGSPCIDAADSAAVSSDDFDMDDDGDTVEPIPFDLDGNRRFVNHLDTQDTGLSESGCPVVDMGAYEFQDGTMECCPADLDGDGLVGPADLAQVLGSWGPCEGCPADFNGDGVVDAADLAQLLGAWGMCP